MKTIFLLTFFILALALGSCNQQRYAYAANKINAPSLQKKSDSRLNASFSAGNARGDVTNRSRNLGFDLQGAYAVSNHFGVITSFYNRWERDAYTNDDYYRGPFSSSVVNYKRSMAEIGGGYFNRPDKNIVLSIYGGLGTGRIRINDAGMADTLAYTRNLSTKLWRYFLQPGFSYVSASRFSVDFSMRLSWLDYTATETNYTAVEEERLRLQNLNSLPVFVFLEPSLTFQIPLTKPGWLRFEASWASAPHTSQIYTRRSNFSFGLTADPYVFLTKRGFGK